MIRASRTEPGIYSFKVLLLNIEGACQNAWFQFQVAVCRHYSNPNSGAGAIYSVQRFQDHFGEVISVVIQIGGKSDSYLFLVTLTIYLFCQLACLIQRRQQHARKNRDDRDNDEQLDKSETLPHYFLLVF